MPWQTLPRLSALSESPPPLIITSIDIQRLPLSALLQALGQQEGLSYDVDECGAIPVSLSQQQVELTELLERVAGLARIRWQLRENRITVRCDQPLQRRYLVDYPAVERSGALTGSASLPATGGLPGTGGSGQISGPHGGQQQTASRHQNRFWDNLIQLLEQSLAAGDELAEPTRTTETEQVRSEQGTLPSATDRGGRATPRSNPGSPATNGPAPASLDSAITRTVTTRSDQRRPQVIAHPESGLLNIRATARQHRQIATLIANTRLRARQQVEIEAFIIEVRLSHQFERGIQWARPPASFSPAVSVSTNGPGLIFSRPASGEDSLGVALRFLEQFGRVHVMSSPRVVTLHQQAALLRMVENRVYFTLSAQTVPAGPNSAAFSTFNTQAHSVPVGFIMSVLPSVDDSQGVTLTLKPSLSRIVGFVSDPNPGLVSAGINSRIPEIQIREIESVLRLQHGQVALLGGFTQSEARSTNSGIPGLPDSGPLNWLGSNQSDDALHSELIVLIRARTNSEGRG